MDELIGLAIDALAAKKARAAPGQAAAEEPAAQRYQRILSDLRARAAGAPPAPSPPVVAPPKRQVTPAPTPPVAAPAVIRAHRGPLQGLFEGGNSLLRAVVAAELLDRPLALRENAHWQKR